MALNLNFCMKRLLARGVVGHIKFKLTSKLPASLSRICKAGGEFKLEGMQTSIRKLKEPLNVIASTAIFNFFFRKLLKKCKIFETPSEERVVLRDKHH